MNLKNQLKESAYVKLILPHSLLPYKNAIMNNQAAVTSPEINRATRFKSLNSLQCYFVDIVFRSGVARFATPIR